MSSRIGVIGAGAWGTAVAKVIADKGNEVVVWSHEKETAEEINLRHSNERYLPGVSLPASLSSVTDPVQAADGMEFLILATPSLFLLDSLKRILHVSSIREGETAIGVITKGFIPTAKGPRLILETLEDYLPGFYRQSLVYIAGPSHAEEVSRGLITGLIAASESAKNSFRFRDLMKTGRLLVFSSLDVRGVQVAAAAKNVIAIAFGMLDALKTSAADKGMDAIFGDGTESLLLAAGLNEIQILGRAMGATHPETFTSISGVGDLDVTCRSVFGRNRRFGREIIEKDILTGFSSLDDLIANIGKIGYLPEGVVAAKYVKALAEEHKLRMPISVGLFRILNREISPVDFLHAFVKDLE
ncbi:MAG: glycerol-3-phosphate dehydrogenase [Treponema sp. GWB1_62_6]|nr:MAG: glycerol-3-phosphate dehydrogenase [Treponema sp. GWA1_62_8]OHE68140.1 MAG: glycerol-3-phosphate dehydrogenase [Treponema sp. RIFOXYC1_FULL_61_9]OHE70053.1 MAG: glycerol-3-phosphate dehydrogenase [Treponema sp. GWC1_61_84]OHE70617.1 MAG: glycerol-3-phosphate dehydrogenase [Treponema sp. GWB1_62_6]HCM25389.1 glycerol-3-phosphate dehydrogenase [Treponema sp.]